MNRPQLGVEVIEQSHRVVIEVREDLLTSLLGYNGYTITSIGETASDGTATVTVYLERPIVEVNKQ